MPNPKPTFCVTTLTRHLRAKDLLVVALLAGTAWHFGAGAGSGATAKAPASVATLTASQAPSSAVSSEGSDAAALPLVTEVAVPGYAPASTERAVFNALNEARARGNFGLLSHDARLDTAAAGHAAYLAQNLDGALSHRQDARRPAFSGETPADRVRASGYDTEVSFEALSNGTTAGGCLELLNTVYHLSSLMVGATDVGIAVHPAAGCVIEPQLPRSSGRMQMRRAGTVGTYPYPGQRRVPPAFMPATETPNPAPDMGDAVLGPPILVDLNSDGAGGQSAGEIVLDRFVLSEAATGQPVEARVLAGRGVVAAATAALELRLDRRLPSAGHVFLLPLAQLKTEMVYTVDFSGSVNGLSVSRRWDFTTR